MKKITGYNIPNAVSVMAAFLFTEWPIKVEGQDGHIDGFSLTRKTDGWLLTVKARYGDRELVSFFFADTPVECLHNAFLDMVSWRTKWRKSKF